MTWNLLYAFQKQCNSIKIYLYLFIVYHVSALNRYIYICLLFILKNIFALTKQRQITRHEICCMLSKKNQIKQVYIFGSQKICISYNQRLPELMTFKLLYVFQKQSNLVGIYIFLFSVYLQIYINFTQTATDQMTCKLLYAF